MKDVHFKVSDEEHQKLVAYCKAKERKISDVMRELIRKLPEQDSSADRR